MFKQLRNLALCLGVLSMTAAPALADGNRGQRGYQDNHRGHHRADNHRGYNNGYRQQRRDNRQAYRQGRQDQRQAYRHNSYQNRGYNQHRGYTQQRRNNAYAYYSRGYHQQNYRGPRVVYAPRYTAPYPSYNYRPAYNVGHRYPAYNRYRVNNYSRYGLYNPPRGHYWSHNNNDAYLVAAGTGLIAGVVIGALGGY